MRGVCGCGTSSAMSANHKNFIYMEYRGFIFSYVPKVACTNWKCLLRHMVGYDDWLDTNIAHDKTNSGLRYLDLTSDDAELLHRPDIHKYTMVRNPYSRILSAYLNKIAERLPPKPEGEGDHFDRLVRIIDEFRNEQTESPEITFEVFLLWLHTSGSWFVNDEHWTPQATLLRQPDVAFDVVGRFENLDADAERIITAMGCNITFPTQESIKFPVNNSEKRLSDFYTPKAVSLVQDHFAQDFSCFGYTSRSDMLPDSPGDEDKHHRFVLS